MKTLKLSPARESRFRDIISIASHPARDQWHRLECLHVDTGQFTASISDFASRWSVSHSVASATVKELLKAGLLTVQPLVGDTLYTVPDFAEYQDYFGIETADLQSQLVPPTKIPSRKFSKSKRRKKALLEARR